MVEGIRHLGRLRPRGLSVLWVGRRYRRLDRVVVPHLRAEIHPAGARPVEARSDVCLPPVPVSDPGLSKNVGDRSWPGSWAQPLRGGREHPWRLRTRPAGRGGR